MNKLRSVFNQVSFPITILLAAGILSVALTIAINRGRRQPKPFNPDSAYVDSLLQDHHQAPGFISSDTADTSTQWVYDSSVRAEYGKRRDSL